MRDRPVAMASTCTTYDNQKKQNSMPPGEIRTRNPSMRAASSPRPGKRCHQDQLKYYSWYVNTIPAFTLKEINTAELHLSGLIGTTSQPDMQKIRITGFFFENGLYWQFEFRPFLFIVCTCI
jgi:hypothetical protein